MVMSRVLQKKSLFRVQVVEEWVVVTHGGIDQRPVD